MSSVLVRLCQTRKSREFEEIAHQLKQQHYNTAALHLYYDETMSHFIYAGADMI